jgi:hypothetical protein
LELRSGAILAATAGGLFEWASPGSFELYNLLRSVSASVRNALRCDAAAVSILEGDHLPPHLNIGI